MGMVVLLMLLTDHEAQSAVWQKVKKHYEERLATLRSKNDTNLDDKRTAKLRGRIAECKGLLGLDKPTPATEADDE